MGKHVTRYSESFRAQVVRELSGGRVANVHAAARFYGIPGKGTVKNWAKRLGREDLVPKVVRMEIPEEQNELKRLQKRVLKPTNKFKPPIKTIGTTRFWDKD